MPSRIETALTEIVRENVHPLTDSIHDYDLLLDRIGNARFVLLGEASHGTHEFYHERALITQRLIQEKDFVAVAVEADWPDAYRANRFVRGASDDSFVIEALNDFKRFQTCEVTGAIRRCAALRRSQGCRAARTHSRMEAGEVPETFPFAV